MRALILLASLCAVGASLDAEWLEENASKEGVVTLPSGLQYKILASGPKDGDQPQKSDSCTCHYEGALIDGSVFDSSKKRGRPATFTPSGVIAGWTEALQLMRPGDKWMLYIPAALGYGARGAGGKIPGGATLVFELELISFAVAGPGMFAGTPFAVLDTEVIAPFKVWHLLLVVVLFAVVMSGGLPGMGGGGKRCNASHILVKEEKVINELKALATSANFAQLAKEYSTCPSGKSGGSLGNFGPGQMVPAFDKVCWSAPIGEVQGPVPTQFGFHLILVTERTDPEESKKK